MCPNVLELFSRSNLNVNVSMNHIKLVAAMLSDYILL